MSRGFLWISFATRLAPTPGSCGCHGAACCYVAFCQNDQPSTGMSFSLPTSFDFSRRSCHRAPQSNQLAVQRFSRTETALIIPSRVLMPVSLVRRLAWDIPLKNI
jgi:hypothetical protein